MSGEYGKEATHFPCFDRPFWEKYVRLETALAMLKGARRLSSIVPLDA